MTANVRRPRPPDGLPHTHGGTDAPECTTCDVADRPTWDDYFLTIADAVATRADCRRRQVGAVVVDADHRIVSTGYNGAPSGQAGCLAGHCPRGVMTPEESAPFSAYDNCIAIHAEANALLYARQSLVGATIYITCRPCNDCAKLIAGAGATRTVFRGAV